MPILEPAVPAFFIGSGALFIAQVPAGDGWIGGVLQGGALVLLAGVLWVIFKELAPRLLNELKEQQDLRHREHVDFVAALSSMREAHLTEMARARQSHEEVIKRLTVAARCDWKSHNEKPKD